jgi:hypothetical protein
MENEKLIIPDELIVTEVMIKKWEVNMYNNVDYIV